MSNFRLRTECVLMQFPWKLLFLVHLWKYTQYELITTGSLAFILVTAKNETCPLCLFTRKKTGVSLSLAWWMALESMWHTGSFPKNRVTPNHYVLCDCSSERCDNICSVSFVFPVNIFILVLLIIFYYLCLLDVSHVFPFQIVSLN